MKNDKLKIAFATGVKYKDLYFFAALHMNALFMFDEKKERLSFLTNFKKEKRSDYLYVKSFLYKDEAWFIPYCADYIAIVNLKNLFIEYIPIISQNMCDRSSIKYVNILNFKNDFLCIIPQEIGSMIIIDLKNKELKTYDNIVEKKETYPYHGAIYRDEIIYLFPWKSKKILITNLITDEQFILPWENGQEAFGDVIYDKECNQLFFAPACNDHILIYNLQEQFGKKIKLKDWNGRGYKTYYSTECERELFFWGHEKNIVIKINKDDYSVKIYNIFHESTGFHYTPISSSNIEALLFDSNCIIRYEKKSDKFEKKYMYTNVKDLLDEIEESNVNLSDVIQGYEGEIFKETIGNGLKKIMICMSRDRKNELLYMINRGKRIYKYICKR